MSNGTALTTTQSNQPITIMQAPPFTETMEIARALAASGFFKDCRAPEQAFAKILAGQEIGIGAMASLSGIHIVDGKPTLDATLVGAQIKKSGRYDYRVKVSNDEQCVLEFFERSKSVGESSFSMAEAARAGLAHKAVWKAYPKDMLRSRAMTRGARMYCPDVFNGAIYTPEEIGAQVEIDGVGAMKVVSVADTPSREAEQPQTQLAQTKDQDDAERAALVNQIYGMIWVDPAIKGQDVHNLRLGEVAKKLGIAPAPQKWGDFSLDQLRAFIARSQAAVVTHCEYCPLSDGVHRDNCPNHPDFADRLADQYQEPAI